MFREIKTLVDQLGRVRTDPRKTLISFKCMAVADHRRAPVLAYVYVTGRTGIRVQIPEKHAQDIPVEHGFTRRINISGVQYREFEIRDTEQTRRAERILRAAYDTVSSPASCIES